MKLARSPWPLFLAGTALLAACATPSIHPIYTSADDQVRDERLVGSWRSKDDKMNDKTTYTVSETKDGYRLHVGAPAEGKDDKPVDSDLDLRLVEMGGHRYIDAAASGAERSRVGDKHGALFVPTHMFAKVQVSAAEVRVWMLKPDFARQAVADKALAGTPLEGDR